MYHVCTVPKAMRPETSMVMASFVVNEFDDVHLVRVCFANLAAISCGG